MCWEPDPPPPPNKTYINPAALRKAKIVYNFGHSECNKVKLKHLTKLEKLFYFSNGKKNEGIYFKELSPLEKGDKNQELSVFRIV